MKDVNSQKNWKPICKTIAFYFRYKRKLKAANAMAFGK